MVQKIISTASLSNLMAQEKIYTREISYIAELKDLLPEKRANLKIMWIPAHVGIGRNERVDRAAKDALEQEVATGHKVGKLDYYRWVKEEFKRKRQND
jgi:ribonuclease HI